MGMAIATAGKTLTNRTLTFKALFPIKIYLAKAYPAIPPIDSEIRIVRPATWRLLIKAGTASRVILKNVL